jgi:hypothetical protein
MTGHLFINLKPETRSSAYRTLLATLTTEESADAGGNLLVPDVLEYGQNSQTVFLGMNQWNSSSPLPPDAQSRHARSEGEVILLPSVLFNRSGKWQPSFVPDNSLKSSLPQDRSMNSDTALSVPISPIDTNPYHHLVGLYHHQMFPTTNIGTGDRMRTSHGSHRYPGHSRGEVKH